MLMLISVVCLSKNFNKVKVEAWKEDYVYYQYRDRILDQEGHPTVQVKSVHFSIQVYQKYVRFYSNT